MSPSRRAVLAGSLATALGTAAPRRVDAAPAPGLVLDDASGLNPTRVARHLRVPERDDALVARVRRLLAEAEAEDRAVVFGGARHSMGGQSLLRDGAAATLSGSSCLPDRAGRSYRATAGTRWRDVTAILDPLGLSVPVMQSNNDFSLGGSVSVNAHGWAAPAGPLGTTVRSLRMVLADGTLLTCSRGENEELFRLAVGGYGLFGIIVDVELAATENGMLEPRQAILPAARVGPRFAEVATGSDLRMAYGRLNVARSGFLEEAVLVTFHPVAHSGPLPPPDTGGLAVFLSGTVLRAQRGSEAGKRARWYAETVLAARFAPRRLTRNRLLNQTASTLVGPGRRHTDILHEYFLPPDRLEGFLAACRRLVPPSGLDLLNVTLRYVQADPVSVLRFAPEHRIAAVMLFSQARTAGAEASMRALTEDLIEAALGEGGSFYLPYRLHATPEQVRRAYPAVDQVLSRKRHYDPRLRLRNAMFDTYFSG